MSPPVRSLLTCVLALLLFGVQGVASVRVEVDGLPVLELRERGPEDTMGWYDAEELLRILPGEVEWDPQQGRLTYREGERWAALRAEAPYAVRDGRPLKGVDPPRLVGGRLLVSARFLRDTASELVGRTLRVVATGRDTLRRIVIDPGHGGDDGGSRGRGDVREKDAALALALAAAERLRQLGYEVHLTRRDDVAMEPVQRAAVANYWGADLFISLHAAGAGRGQARGFEIFAPQVPPPGTDPASWAGGQVGVHGESLRWAETLRLSLGETLPVFDRGVRVVASPLLEGASMPACVLEAGNLDWPQEADLFLTAEGRDLLAGGIEQAVVRYFQNDGGSGGR